MEDTNSIEADDITKIIIINIYEKFIYPFFASDIDRFQPCFISRAFVMADACILFGCTSFTVDSIPACIGRFFFLTLPIFAGVSAAVAEGIFN
jgi:hypothetical protein